MIIDLTGVYTDRGLLLINPNREFNVSDGFHHYHIDLDDGTITKTKPPLTKEGNDYEH